MLEMPARVAAAEAAVRRFSGRAFAWSTNDCVRLAAFTLRKLGYRVALPKAGSYRSAPAALKALRAAGFADLAEALDRLPLPAIPVAAALPGDLLGFPGEGDWTALGVALGNGRCLMFAGGQCVIGADASAGATRAWRATPCRR